MKRNSIISPTCAHKLHPEAYALLFLSAINRNTYEYIILMYMFYVFSFQKHIYSSYGYNMDIMASMILTYS